MEKRIYGIEPVFEQRIWGTQHLREKYQYKTELDNIAEVYNVCAMPGHLDNIVTGTGMRLSEFYHRNRELFECPAADLPVEICMAHSNSFLSIQNHPDDSYALEHEGSRGRPEGWVILEGLEKNRMVMGHYAHDKKEFQELSMGKEWDRLFRYIEMEPGQYIHVPAGSLHAFCKDAVAVAFSTNADITYRLYDFDRVDASTGRPRELHIQKLFDTITVPDDRLDCFWPKKYEADGCTISDFYDEEGVYTSGRIELTKEGIYHTGRFMFYVCVGGAGEISGVPIKAGETVFVPAHFGNIILKGTLDLMYITYREK